jgi:hypothetical protein
MNHFIEPPRITASALDTQTHLVSVLNAEGELMMRPPSGTLVLEIWAAHVPAGTSVERAYVAYGWMKPAMSLPVKIQVASVTGHDPARTVSGRWHLFYKARWAREGTAASNWSNVAVVEDGEKATHGTAAGSSDSGYGK